LPTGLEKKIGKESRPGSGDGRDGGTASSGRPNLYGRGGRRRRGAREGEEDEEKGHRGGKDVLRDIRILLINYIKILIVLIFF